MMTLLHTILAAATADLSTMANGAGPQDKRPARLRRRQDRKENAAQARRRHLPKALASLPNTGKSNRSKTESAKL